MQDEPKPGTDEPTGTFSEAEYDADMAKVIAHAAATGRAVVVAEDGRPVVILSIPIVDLPILG